MIEVLVIMSAGIIVGYLMRHRRRAIRIFDSLLVWSIFLLLFLLGFTIGRDPLIMSALPSLGMIALVISVAAMTGSILLAFILWKFFYNKK